jgi:superfamily II DNA/RNA helicase
MSHTLVRCTVAYLQRFSALFSDFFLHERLIKAIDKLGFEQPTPVQSQVIPPALEHKDLKVSAETGSGKTAAFLLPILHHLLSKSAPDTGTRALVLAPTRELARQILRHCKELAAFTGLQAEVITGGAGYSYQVALFRKNPEIIIATPGRLLEHLEKGNTDFSDLEVLVLDEADRMLDMGFSEDVLSIAASCNRERQTLLFSATLHQRGLAAIAQKVLREPETLTLNTVQDERTNIRRQIVLADDSAHKSKLTAWLLDNETYDKALVFTNSKVQADSLGGYLRYQKQRVGVLHSGMDQDARNRTMGLLRNGGINVLVATDVASRGLDVKGIDLVINFDMARSGDDYIHRIGRTGRAGEEGLAVALIASNEWNLMSSIERYLRQPFERRTIKGLEGQYKGPKKLKKSGKAAGSKKKKAHEKKVAPKGKQRQRDKKNVGKRRKPSTATVKEAGLGPPKRKS